MSNDKKNKLRADFRKNRQPRARQNDLTRDYAQQDRDLEESAGSERLSGKGELTRKRTIIGSESQSATTGFSVSRDVDEISCLPGRVLSVYGLESRVVSDDGRMFRCATRRLLKTMTTELRQVLIAGDRVWFRPEGTDQGFVERIEPRHGILSRTSRGRQHVIVANVDQMLIVTSAAQPDPKPNLIDRFLVSAEQTKIRPIVCLNKIDLVDPADFEPLVGVYGQLGYAVHLVSATTGQGMERLRIALRGRQSVVVGQSGVGKSSLLNTLDPLLALRVREVSDENDKGKHTTTTARLIPLASGGYVVDTPGIRQFELWDIIAEELDSLFREFRPYVHRCKFPNCTHTHEVHCAVKDAVADGRLDVRRYESYCHLRSGD